MRSISRRSACPRAPTCAVVHNYMAHHSGMSIAAVADAVFEGRLRDRFHSDPVIELAELLLQERAPRDIPTATVRTEADERSKDETEVESPDTRIVLDPLRALRFDQRMSNGRYSVMVTATGSGYSRWGDLAVTRWQPDPREDRLGSYHLPARRQHRRLVVGHRRAEARGRRDGADRSSPTTRRASSNRSASLRSEVECIVVSEGNGEGRAGQRSTMTAPPTGTSR